MSWLARSIVNSLKLDDDHGEDHVYHHVDDEQSSSLPSKSKQQNPQSPSSQTQSSSPPSSSSQSQPERGVKEDLSELTKTLTRQFWGVASFLAPPVDHNSTTTTITNNSESNQSDSRSDRDRDDRGEDGDVVGVSGIRSDFAEIGGKVKSGISKLSSNIAVSEITKIASSFLQFGSDHDAVGVTEEVISFAKNIVLHPETWLDFPLPDDHSDDDEDSEDFDMTDAQQEHALAVERLVPELTAIRIEICPEYLSEDHFWKIYFVLLHPRLNKDDAELLSTPQILKARAMLMHELPSRMKAEPEFLAGDVTQSNKTNISSPEEQLSVPSPVTQPESPLLKTFVHQSDITAEPSRPNQNSDVEVIDKSIVENPTKDDDAVSASSIVMVEKYEDDGDDWLKEESSEPGEMNDTTIPVGNDEDVSFSDLEDEDDEDVATSHTRK